MTIFGELEKHVAAKSAGMPEAEQQQQNPGRGFAGELVNSLVYRGIEDPIRAVTQTIDSVFNTKLTKSVTDGFATIGIEKPGAVAFNSASWYGQNLGGGLGMLPFYFAARGLVGNRAGAAFDRFAKLEAGMKPSLAYLSGREGMAQATTGLFYGTVLSSTNDANIGTWGFVTDRIAQGAGDMAIFGTLGATTPGLSRGLGRGLTSIERATSLPVAQFGAHTTFVNRVGTGLLAAPTAGLMAAEVNALKDGRFVPTLEEVGHSTASMAFVGTALGGAGWATAQRPGTYSTNARWVTDGLGLTTKAPADAPATFRILRGQTEFNSFKQDLAKGTEPAQADITVQPRLNTVGSAIFGPRFGGKWGEAQTLSLMHRGLGSNSPTAAELINADLVATCLPLEGVAATKDVMPGRAQSPGDGQIVLQQTGRPEEFTLSREPLNEARTDGKAEGTTTDRATENETEGQAYALGTERRVTGPSTRQLKTHVDVMGQELANGAIRMNFDAYGDRLNTNIGAATISSIGLTGNGWPYFEVGVGLKSWTLNGQPLQPGRNYLDIKGGDVLNYNGILNLTLIPGARVGKAHSLELRAENLLPPEARGIRDVNAEMFLNGQKFDLNTEVPILRNPATVPTIESRAMADLPTEGFFVGRRADGRLYFRANGDAGTALINGREVPADKEVAFCSSDHVTLPNGIQVRIDNHGQPKPEPPPRPERPPREPAEGREPRDPLSETEGPSEPVTVENGDIIDPLTGIVLKEGAETGEGTGEPKAMVDNSGPIPIIKIGEGTTEGTDVATDGVRVEPSKVEPPAKDDAAAVVTNPPTDGRPKVVNDGKTEVAGANATTGGVELPQSLQGPGEVKLQPHKDVRNESWTPTMESMIAKAERVQLADGSWYPRFKSEADARTAARYFSKQLQSNRSEHVRFGHGQVKDGFAPMADFDGVEVGVITFRQSPATGEVWLGVTGPDGKVTDMVPYKKPADQL
jgi:hypothetical protein